MKRERVGRWLACATFVILAAAGSARAQEKEPLPVFVADVQGALPRLPTDALLASPRGLAADALPSWGTGFNLAAHFYPVRGARFALGVGGNYQWVRGSKSPEVEEDEDPLLAGPTVTTRFSGFAPQVSLNFGHRRGWSYLSGGIGRTTLTISRDDALEEEGDAVSAINWGGGARWFMKDHLAFSLDVRVYRLQALEATVVNAGHAGMNLLVLNLGVSFQ